MLYPTLAEHLETWLELASAGQFDGQGGDYTPKTCGHDYFVVFSCKGRGVGPSCNTRRMVETAAHLSDHVLPRLPVRPWVLSVPKRLRYFMQRDGAQWLLGGCRCVCIEAHDRAALERLLSYCAKTPLECLVLLNKAKLVTFKSVATLDSLLDKAKQRTDLQAAREMQKAKTELFAMLNKPGRKSQV